MVVTGRRGARPLCANPRFRSFQGVASGRTVSRDAPGRSKRVGARHRNS